MDEVITNGVLQVVQARRILEEEIKKPKDKEFFNQDLENIVTMIRGLPQGIVSGLIEYLAPKEENQEKNPFTFVSGDSGGMMLKRGPMLSATQYGRAQRLYRKMMVLSEPPQSVDIHEAQNFYNRLNNEIEHDVT